MTLAEMRALHPPPADVGADGSLLESTFSFDLPAPVDTVWALVSDTSRVNRALGIGEMRFEERDGVLHGATDHFGLRQEWIEEPWAWVAGSHLTSLRRYTRGIARAVWGVYHLEPLDGGERTRFQVYFGWVPRGLLSSLAIRYAMGWVARRYGEVVGALAEVRALLALPPPPPPVAAPEADARVRAIRAALVARGLDAAVIDRLLDHVRAGDELDLHRLQVIERARAWSVDEDELLRTCLHATRLGLLDLRWDVICPHCRGVRAALGELGDVPAQSGCEICGIDFATDQENAVEITFRVHPSIRDVPERFYCSAEPATKTHVKLQLALAPGEERTVATRLAPGLHRLRLRAAKEHALLDVHAPDAEPAALRWTVSGGPSAARAGAHPTLTLVNDGDAPATFIVEAAQWADTALRPGRLLSFQEFRDLFSEQYLGAGVQLEVGEQTILFTDMVGSTAFYTRRGDASAFAEVKGHFDALFALIAGHRGAVVKTIGDATMAAFCSPLDAVKAALAIVATFPEDRADTPIRLRVSLHTGPCIAVRIHQGIDYFGGTVNLAAKLQSLADAGDVTLSRRTYDAPGVADHLAAQAGTLEATEYRSAAIEAPLAAMRLRTFRR
jgi:class 3 adenylate cyclase